MHALLSAIVSLGFLTAVGCAPAFASGHYEDSTIVTGMDMRSRPEGLRRVLRQVLTKVSGNPAWITDARVDSVEVETALQGFLYLDRDSDFAKHDEQGTRDRPYDLVARFDPEGIDSILRSLDDRAWAVPRPIVAIDVAILPRRGLRFPLRADTDVDERHREAIVAAADRFGIDIVIPAMSRPLVAPASGWPVLEGELVWSDPDAGWYTNWRLRWNETVYEWGSRGTGFDPAYRDGMSGVAAILSGHRR